MRGFMGEPYDQDPHPGEDHVFDSTGHCRCGAETPDVRDRRVIGYDLQRLMGPDVSDAEFWRIIKRIAKVYIQRI